MILIQLAQWQNPIPYHLAGQPIWCDQPIPSWDAYEQLPTPVSLPHCPTRPIDQPEPALLRFQGQAWLGGAPHFLTAYGGHSGYWLISQKEGQTAYIAPNGQTIFNLSAISSPMATTLITGAALILALALQGIFCLHASTIVVNQQLVVFMGESGKGKSTLAYFGSQILGPQTGDDILPMPTPHTGRLDFPQPQPLKYESPELPLHSVYLLAEGELGLQPLSPIEATLALIRHTVGSRLFDPQLLANQLAFCAGISATIPVKKLTYPRQWEMLPAVIQTISHDLL